jgi:murein endopeptidase
MRSSRHTLTSLAAALAAVASLAIAPAALAEQNPGVMVAPAAIVQLESTPGFRVRDPSRAFGTAKAVRLFADAVEKASQAFSHMPVLPVGDMSHRGGGHMRPHRSHRDGRDIDVGYYFKDGKSHRYFEKATPKNLDVPRTWSLVEALLDTHEVEYIFIQTRLQKPLYAYALKTGASKAMLDRVFQFPRGRRSKRGIIRHERGHDDHIHVRFRAD